MEFFAVIDAELKAHLPKWLYVAVRILLLIVKWTCLILFGFVIVMTKSALDQNPRRKMK